MESIIDILSHPYFVLNRISETLYDGNTAAEHQRLRSRVKGRHRFTVDEYKALRKLLTAFCRRLEAIATKIDNAVERNSPRGTDWLKKVHHPWLNHKNVLIEVGKARKLSYLNVYDQLRLRAKKVGPLPGEIAAEYRNFAKWLHEQLERAEKEKKGYSFSQGRGGASHRPRSKDAPKAKRPSKAKAAAKSKTKSSKAKASSKTKKKKGKKKA